MMRPSIPRDWPPVVAEARHRTKLWEGTIQRNGLSAGIVFDMETALLSYLTLPPARDWLARWLAGVLDLGTACTAPDVRLSARCWLDIYGEIESGIAPSEEEADLALSCSGYCPLLRELDPKDPRVLDDGSRLVDAVALGVTALWVWSESEHVSDGTEGKKAAEAMVAEYKRVTHDR